MKALAVSAPAAAAFAGLLDLQEDVPAFRPHHGTLKGLELLSALLLKASTPLETVPKGP